MKTTKYITLLALLLVLLTANSAFSQWIYNFKCGMEETEGPGTVSFGSGMTKPMQTLPVNDESKYFRVLLVYVEFKDDNSEPDETYWPIGEPPVYAGDLFAPQKELGLNAYEDYYLSDYFNKISNDKFDMVGDVKHLTLNEEYSHYVNLGGNCFDNAMLDVLKLLDTSSNISDRADWPRYDLWEWDNNAQEFQMESDGYIDMIYIQFRKADMCGMTSGGYGALIVNYSTINNNKEIDGRGIHPLGSGVMGINGWKMPIGAAIGYFRHEYCHYTLGNHRPYSTIGGGDGTNTICGSELGFSPQDLITVGLADVTTYTGSPNSFELADMQTTGEVLKVPTETSGEYFLIGNRRRIAGTGDYTWDCNMTGDTTMGEPFKQYLDYSKGLYIYHVESGNDFQAWVDLEAADGLWNWEQTGTTTPDWSSSQTLPVLMRTTPGFTEDNPTAGYYYDASRMVSRDGQSVISQSSNPYPGWGQKWFSLGERHTTLGDQGIDRTYTNAQEDWCSRETGGDRWDAWAIGYNQVFSPYSSPNTKDRSNEQTGIFIYYEHISSNVAVVNVYQADANTQEEDDVLAVTPPSKPILYRPVEIYNCNSTYGYPRITWDNSLEPDMLRASGQGSFKRYKVYRAASADLNTLPDPYSYLGTYDDYTPTDTVSYIDFTTITSCGFVNENERYYRYKVTAVDSYDDESVRSDFVSLQGAASTSGDNNGNNSEPIKFNLSQNYPNPFNPVTEIKYSIPNNSFVTLKVYNTIGQVVAELVNNEYKTTGSYSIAFDASNLASGIYFYSLEAGTFKDVKKMVLIK